MPFETCHIFHFHGKAGKMRPSTQITQAPSSCLDQLCVGKIPWQNELPPMATDASPAAFALAPAPTCWGSEGGTQPWVGPRWNLVEPRSCPYYVPFQDRNETYNWIVSSCRISLEPTWFFPYNRWLVGCCFMWFKAQPGQMVVRKWGRQCEAHVRSFRWRILPIECWGKAQFSLPEWDLNSPTRFLSLTTNRSSSGKDVFTLGKGEAISGCILKLRETHRGF